MVTIHRFFPHYVAAAAPVVTGRSDSLRSVNSGMYVEALEEVRSKVVGSSSRRSRELEVRRVTVSAPAWMCLSHMTTPALVAVLAFRMGPGPWPGHPR